jgi:inorganic pyrophosphatase
MKNFFFYILLSKIIIFGTGTAISEDNYNDLNIFNEDGSINVVIEIPAGTIEKWEVDKKDLRIKQEIKDGKFRVIDYLAYPFNYGFIPKTILPVNKGGDGDHLDVVVIGPSVKRGSVIKVKPIGTIILLDSGEIDSKIIALSLNDTNLSKMNSIQQLKEKYTGIMEIIKIWLQNYNGEILEIKGELNKMKTQEYIKSFSIDLK